MRFDVTAAQVRVLCFFWVVNILFEGLDHNHANCVNNEWPLLSCNKIHQPPGCLWATGFDLGGPWATGFDKAMNPLSCLWVTRFDLCHLKVTDWI